MNTGNAESLASSGGVSLDTPIDSVNFGTTDDAIRPAEPTAEQAADQQPADPTAAVTGKTEIEKPAAEQQERPRSRAQERIEQLSATIRDRDREIDALRKQSKPQTAKNIDPLDYPNDAAYHAALAKQVATEAQSAAREERASEAERQRAEATQQLWDARAGDYKESVPDFEAVVYDSNTPMHRITLDVVRGMERGPAVAYYLGKNQDHASRLSRMSPVDQVMELGRIDQRLSSATPKKVTSAPRVPTTVGGVSSSAGFRPDGDDIDGYFAWREKQ